MRLQWLLRVSQRSVSTKALSLPVRIKWSEGSKACLHLDNGTHLGLQGRQEGDNPGRWIDKRDASSQVRAENADVVEPLPNVKTPPTISHQEFGIAAELWMLDPSSPGSPIFLPNGTHIFLKLVERLRHQHKLYGFQEVLTPTIYKQDLWKRSGHWDHYKDDMFMVKRGSEEGQNQKSLEQSTQDTAVEKGRAAENSDQDDAGLKPMNCPGHCLIYQSKPRTSKELPIRFTEFSPLHRNENSGSLSGLTRVRRFHQDDGHIFCRQDQIITEVQTQLAFMRSTYKTFGLEISKIYLSLQSVNTTDGFLGNLDEWKNAESQLKWALERENIPYIVDHGEAAFYGPKIDVTVKDTQGKEHQTATIQLDFQMPKRFELVYQGESSGERPVMIHRAVFGSLERFMALLTEQYGRRWPFWLSPKQVIILTVNTAPDVLVYAQSAAKYLRNALGSPYQPTFLVEVDDSKETLQKKIARVKKDASGIMYGVICVIGIRDLQQGKLNIDLSGQQDPVRAMSYLKEKVSSPSEGEDTGRGIHNDDHKIDATPKELLQAMKGWEAAHV